MNVKTEPVGSPRDRVRVGDDLWVPTMTTVAATGRLNPEDPPVDVEIDVVPENGRLVAQEVRVRRRPDGPPVTSEAIRSVPVAALTQFAAREVQRIVDIADNGEISAVLAGVPEEQVQYVRDHGLTDKTIEIVAHTYRLALLMGNTPTKMVEEWLEVPRSTAGRWIATARERGLLSKAEGRGKAGG
ncbi:MAG: hypothetical protein WAN20_25385 [Pseudonocardiaceae bacterium]